MFLFSLNETTAPKTLFIYTVQAEKHKCHPTGYEQYSKMKGEILRHCPFNHHPRGPFGSLTSRKPHSILWLLSKVEGMDQFLNLTSEAA